MNLAGYIEPSTLAPDTILTDIESVCRQAIDNRFSTLCVPPLFVKKAKLITAQSDIEIATVIGFPLGYNAIEAKVAELVLAIIDGADEVEMVANTSAIKNKDWQYIANELNTVLRIVRNKQRKLTIILEPGLLTREEMIAACDIYGVSGVDFVKLGTGYIENDGIIDNVKHIRRHLAEAIKIKVWVNNMSQGILEELASAGANRFSCNYRLTPVGENLAKKQLKPE